MQSKKTEKEIIMKNIKKAKNEFVKELEALPTKSARIRFLDSKGMPRAQIARELNIIYQHVRNVLEMPVKKQKV